MSSYWSSLNSIVIVTSGCHAQQRSNRTFPSSRKVLLARILLIRALRGLFLFNVIAPFGQSSMKTLSWISFLVSGNSLKRQIVPSSLIGPCLRNQSWLPRILFMPWPFLHRAWGSLPPLPANHPRSVGRVDNNSNSVSTHSKMYVCVLITMSHYIIVSFVSGWNSFLNKK